MTLMRTLAATTLSLGLLGTGAAIAAPDRQAGQDRPDATATAFAGVDRTTAWRLARRIRLDFPTHHPQGFALVGDRIFMSTVEVTERPVKHPAPVDGHDRTAGSGVGHLLVMTRDGSLVADVVLGEGTVYHPGGIDHDGRDVWVPVAEYRPDSRSVVYRVDAETLRVREAFWVDDHVGGVVRDRRSGRVHGVSWGSRRLYTWAPSGRRLAVRRNPDHMLDLQDCAAAGGGTQLCSGITGLATPEGGSYELGGLSLSRLRDGRVLHEVPFPRFSTAGHVVTRNPVALELDGDTLRLLAAPDDGDEGVGTELLVYEAPAADR